MKSPQLFVTLKNMFNVRGAREKGCVSFFLPQQRRRGTSAVGTNDPTPVASLYTSQIMALTQRQP